MKLLLNKAHPILPDMLALAVRVLELMRLWGQASMQDLAEPASRS